MSKLPIYIAGASYWPRIRIPDRLHRAPLYLGTILAASALGVVSAGQDALFVVQLVVGLPIMAALWRYRYALLLCWALTGAVVASNVPFVNGNNIDKENGHVSKLHADRSVEGAAL